MSCALTVLTISRESRSPYEAKAIALSSMSIVLTDYASRIVCLLRLQSVTLRIIDDHVGSADII